MVLGSCQVAHTAEIIVLALPAVVSHVFNGSGQTDVALIVSKEKLFLIYALFILRAGEQYVAVFEEVVAVVFRFLHLYADHGLLP